MSNLSATPERRFYVEALYTFDEASTATILRLRGDIDQNEAMTDTAVIFEDQTGIVVSVNLTILEDDDLIDALADALDYANTKLCAILRETTIPIPLPWSVKVIDGAGMETAMLSRAEVQTEEVPEDDGLTGVGAVE